MDDELVKKSRHFAKKIMSGKMTYEKGFDELFYLINSKKGREHEK
jgi:hypothetical protein